MSAIDFTAICGKFMECYDAEGFKSLFGVDAVLAQRLWNIIVPHISGPTEPYHFLWSLHYLRRYPVQADECARLGVDHKTYAKHVKEIILLLYRHLPELPWNERKSMANWPISGIVDCTRCKIKAPVLSPWEYYSYKDHFHALKYEVVVGFTGDQRIIWANGPYKAAFPDISVYRDKLLHILEVDEVLLGDKGYIGASHLLTPHKPARTAEERRFDSKLNRARQDIERVNKRIKDWFLFASTYRSRDYDFHGYCFVVVCKILNMVFESEPL